MPPVEATNFPSAGERAAAASWVRGALNRYAELHAGEPGRVTVRRLTSAEYAYAIEDLTGIPIKVGIDASSDSVGGEGFTNFGDVQLGNCVRAVGRTVWTSTPKARGQRTIATAKAGAKTTPRWMMAKRNRRSVC
jgi:hypothetical protein